MGNSKFSTQDLLGQTTEILYTQLNGLKKESFNLRFQQALGDLKNTSKFKIIKKDIARIKTELSKRLAGE
ncbi:50S ribosomal protein L29 [Candidatus Trichorickettsia mobilis]|jgi:large subunit ribosomal protein L29|uniref:50S ribosomal protein L29 n=1 Tax=Candidatus Trichorickettsia mobilis TaxID=1346319 RepID=UPI0029300300|nr:50S ribosomal protein L29 [Candidatus Trichorickettsia mobilis]